MKKILFPLTAFVLLLAPLSAGNYGLPKQDPVFNVSFPAKWNVTHEDKSLEAITEDDAIAVFVQLNLGETVEASIDESIKHLTECGVKLDNNTKQDTVGEANGLELSGILFDGTDEDGPCRVTLNFIHLDDEQVVTIVYWGSEAASKIYGADLDSILNSMKTIKANTAKEGEADEEDADEEE